MRIWSLHPKHIDSKGLVALWRETLLAKNVLKGNTIGYKNHPQLDRFKAANSPIGSINNYLHHVWYEANKRGYNFDKSKYTLFENVDKINVTTGQLNFEREHILSKLKVRDFKMYHELINITKPEIHPLFNQIEGEIEPWERI